MSYTGKEDKNIRAQNNSERAEAKGLNVYFSYRKKDCLKTPTGTVNRRHIIEFVKKSN